MTSSPDTLRVLTLNIQVGLQTAHYGHYLTGAWRHLLPSRGVRDNLDRIAELASAYDVVALQEADAGSLRTGQLNQVEYLARRAQMPYWHAAVNRNFGPFAQHCLGFLSRRPLHQLHHHALPGRVPGRGALCATLELSGGRSLQLIVTHLSLARVSRARQLDHIAGLIDAQRPALLLGDLNCEVRELLAHRRLRSAGLTPISGTPTFPSWRPRRRLDHLLHTSQLRVLDSQVLPAPLSDHLAVAAEFQIAP